MWRNILAGAAAGAAGTTALNAVTYSDMVWRGRAASQAPDKTVEVLAQRSGTAIPGDGDTRQHRLTGLGALSGIMTGVCIGAFAGALRGAGIRLPAGAGAVLLGAAAMAATDGSMAALKVSDPRQWSPADWLSDALPHLAYGAVTSGVLDALTRRPKHR